MGKWQKWWRLGRYATKEVALNVMAKATFAKFFDMELRYEDEGKPSD